MEAQFEPQGVFLKEFTQVFPFVFKDFYLYHGDVFDKTVLTPDASCVDKEGARPGLPVAYDEIKRLSLCLKQAELEVKRLDRFNEQILKSYSWRITRSLRHAAKRFPQAFYAVIITIKFF